MTWLEKMRMRRMILGAIGHQTVGDTVLDATGLETLCPDSVELDEPGCCSTASPPVCYIPKSIKATFTGWQKLNRCIGGTVISGREQIRLFVWVIIFLLA